MTIEEGFKWKCKRCGKEIKSFYLTQFNYNKEQHQKKCNKKEVSK